MVRCTSSGWYLITETLRGVRERRSTGAAVVRTMLEVVLFPESVGQNMYHALYQRETSAVLELDG